MQTTTRTDQTYDRPTRPVRLADYPKRAVGLSLDDISAAQRRTAGYLRYTPVMKARLAVASGGSVPLALKMENLQVTGGYQVRGLLNKVLGLPPELARRGLACSSGAGGYSVSW